MKLVNELNKKTVAYVLKKLSIGDLEILSKVHSNKLRESLKDVLSAKKALRSLRDLYSKL